MTTAAVSREQIVETLKGMTLIEVSELVKELETTFGVTAAVPAAVAPGAAAGPAAGAEEEKTEFIVVLTDTGANKINVIKELRVVIPGLGLKEAKDLAEGAPKTIKEGIGKEDATKIKTALEKVGAKVELK